MREAAPIAGRYELVEPCRRRHASPTALDLRRNIGILLLSEGKAAEAVAELQPLYEDLRIVYGSDHEETQEVADLLARLRLVTPR